MNTRLLFVTALGLLGAHASAHAQSNVPAAPSEAAPLTAPAPFLGAPPVVPEPYVPPLTPPGATVYVAPGAPLYVAPPQAQAPIRRMPARPARRGYPTRHAAPRRHGDAGAPFALGLGGDFLWRNDHASRLLAHQKTLGAFDAFATYDVWSARGVIIALGASVRAETQLGNSDYQLRNDAIQAEAMARYGLTSWLWPHVRVAVGGVTSRFQRHDNASGLRFDDRNGSAAGTFGAGFTLRTPTRAFETYRGRLASLSFGLLVEGGYTVAKDANFTLQPTHSSDVPRATFSVGNIQRSAAYLRLAFVMRI